MKQESKQDIILRLTEGLNAQQRSVPQLPAQAQARKIKVLGAKTDPKHPFAGYMVGADESAEPGKKNIGPDKNDPYEKGWRAGFRHNESNPYPAGSKQAAQWDRGYAEAEAQPNHYDESLAEVDFNPGRRGFLKKAGAVAATAAMPTGLAGAAAKAIAPAASWASTLSAPLAGLTAIDLDDIINLLMTSNQDDDVHGPYDLDTIKKIAVDAARESWGNAWFMNGNAAKALLDTIELGKKKGMDDEDIIQDIFIVTKKQYMQELKQLSPEEVAKVKSQSLNPDSKSEPAASPTTGMSGLARAAGAQIGRTATKLGKATAKTILNQPARDMGRIEPTTAPAALPAPTTSTGMQIPKQKARVAAKQDNELDEAEFNPGRRGFLKKAGAVAAGAAMPKGLAGAAMKAVAPAPAAATAATSILSKPLIDLQMFDWSDIVDVLKITDSKFLKPGYEPEGLDMVKQIAWEGMFDNPDEGEWFSNMRAPKALLNAIEIGEKNGMSEADIINDLRSVATDLHEKEIERLNAKDLKNKQEVEQSREELKKERLRSTGDSTPAASTPSGMSGLVRAAGAQIGRTMKNVGKATADTILNQPAKSAALPAPSVSPGMQIPKQKARVAASPFNDDHSELDQFVKEEFNRDPDDLDEYADLEEGWKSKLAGAALAGAAAFGGGGAQANDQIAKDTQAITQAIQSGQMKSQEFAAGEIRPSQIYSHPKWLETVQAMNKKYPGNSEQARQAAITAIKQMIQQGNVREGAGTVGGNNPAAAWPDFGTAKTYESQLAEAKQRLVEAESRYVLYFNGKPASHYATEAEAKRIADSIKAKHPTVKIEIKNEMHEGDLNEVTGDLPFDTMLSKIVAGGNLQTLAAKIVAKIKKFPQYRMPGDDERDEFDWPNGYPDGHFFGDDLWIDDSFDSIMEKWKSQGPDKFADENEELSFKPSMESSNDYTSYWNGVLEVLRRLESIPGATEQLAKMVWHGLFSGNVEQGITDIGKPGVSEGKPQKRADRYHINKDGKPASLASYADKSSAVKDRDAKYPDAKVHQVGPRGKVKGEFEEGMAEGKWNYPPEYTKKANADDEAELGVSLINKDARKAWRKKQKAKAHKELMTGKKKEPGVAEGAKVDRMVKHIASSEKATGKSNKDAENIAWATANKRGYLDNKNKKKHVAEAGTPADIRAKNRAVVKKIQGKEADIDEGWKSKLAGAALAGAAALGGGAQAQTTDKYDTSWGQSGYDTHIKSDRTLTKTMGSDPSKDSHDFQKRIQSVTGPNAKGEYKVVVIQGNDIVSHYVTKTPPKSWMFKEDITQEDIITKLKAKLGDYLSDLGQQIKKDPALQDKLSAKPPGDQVGPPVKTLTTDDGHEISIHGNEDDGFRISIKNRQTPSKFDSLDEAVMACEMYRAHRRKQALNADYVEEA